MSTNAPSTTPAWRAVVIGDHVRFLRRGIHSRAELGTEGTVLNLHYGDIHTAKRAHLDGLSFCRFPTLTSEQAAGLDLLQDGDLVLADASEDLDGVGKGVEIRRLGDRVAVAGMHTIVARLDKATFADGFKAYLLHIPDFRLQIARMAAGTKVYGITRAHVAAVALTVPPIGEQEAIAEALSDADALIESLEQLIAKKRLIKQGVMQELLTGKRRLPGFEGEWAYATLGSIAFIKTGSRNNQDKVADGEYPFFVRSAQVERISCYSYDCEAILVPGEGGIGSIFHYIKGKFEVHQRVYAVRQFAEHVSGKFVYFYMAQFFGSHALENSVKATVDSLRLPTFQNFVLRLPPTLNEQVAIAEVLSDVDADLDAMEARLNKVRALKQGMMQQLLTGRIRLL